MEDLFMKVNKVRIGFNTHRLEFGGTANLDGDIFWYSMPYFEDITIDLPDMEFQPLTPAEVVSTQHQRR